MTEDRLAQIRAREAAASKGDWGTSHINPTHVRAYDPNGFGAYNPVAIAQGRSDAQSRADAEFIANAPDDMAWLMAMVDRAAAMLADPDGVIDEMMADVWEEGYSAGMDWEPLKVKPTDKNPYRKEANGGD